MKFTYYQFAMFDRGVTLTVVTLVVFDVVLTICADGGDAGREGDPALCYEVCKAADRGLEEARGFCDICENSSKDIPVVDDCVTIGSPELICHDAHNLSIGWNPTRPEKDDAVPLIFFVVKLMTNGGDRKIYYNVNPWRQYTISTFHNLPYGTSFHAEVRAATSRGWSGMPVSSATIRTHPLTLGEHTAAVSRVWNDEPLMLDDGANKGTRVLKITIHWEPSEDLTCAYDVKVISTNNDYAVTQEPFTPGRGYNATFIGLKYDTKYFAVVSARFSEYSSSRSTDITFRTPTCLNYNGQNISLCTPSKPVLRTTEDMESAVLDADGSYRVRVDWEQPATDPDQYNVTLITDTNKTYINIVNGTSETTLFSGVELKHTYFITIEALSPAGRSEAERRKCSVQHLQSPMRKPHSVGGVLVYALAIPACSLVVCIALAAFIYRRHNRIKLYKKRCRYFEELDRKAPPESCDVSIRCLTNIDTGLDGGSLLSVIATAAVDDRFELNPERLSLLEALGEGAFGLVRRALLTGERGEEKEVAVKMLKDNPTTDEARQFQCEIEMMKSVGARTHPHIVSALGACTRAPCRRPLLVVEYCARGDLQNYLRYAWEVLSTNRKWSTPNNDHTKKSGYSKLESQSDVNMSTFVVNRLYDLDLSADNQITAVDLLSFSRQIAMGMEFLSSNRVVHRDLAARNVLVCADKTVKIADFGLSRDVYQNNMYKKTTGGKLPIKWMAIESLTHQIYTTHSDVWSFGVVLWEIVTLGGNPYPGVPTGQLLKLLLSGHRMECPANCSPELYGLMSSCWRARPKSRPTFAELRLQLDALLNGVCSKDYLNLEVLHYKDIEDFRKDTFELPESNSKVMDKIASNCPLYKTFESESCYVKPISKSGSREALRTTQNYYSDMPMLPLPSPPAHSTPLGTANKKLLC